MPGRTAPPRGSGPLPPSRPPCGAGAAPTARRFAPVPRDGDLHPVAQPGLRQDPADAAPYRCLLDRHDLRDLAVRPAVGHQLDDLPLARGQLGEQGVRQAPIGRVQASRPAQDLAGDPWGQHRLSSGQRVDGTGDVLPSGVLEKEAHCARGQPLERVIVLVVRGQDEDVHPGERPDDPPGRLDPVHTGHAHVHQDDVRDRSTSLPQAGDHVQRGTPVLGLGDDGDSRVLADDQGQSEAFELVVVDDHDPDHGAVALSAPSGATVASITQPLPSGEPA